MKDAQQPPQAEPVVESRSIDREVNAVNAHRDKNSTLLVDVGMVAEAEVAAAEVDTVAVIELQAATKMQAAKRADADAKAASDEARRAAADGTQRCKEATQKAAMAKDAAEAKRAAADRAAEAKRVAAAKAAEAKRATDEARAAKKAASTAPSAHVTSVSFSVDAEDVCVGYLPSGSKGAGVFAACPKLPDKTCPVRFDEKKCMRLTPVDVAVAGKAMLF